MDRRINPAELCRRLWVVEVLAPGHHNRPCLGFGGEVVSGQHLVFQTSWRLMEQKNPALTSLEVAGRDLLRYTQELV